MRSKEVAELAGVTVRALRHYHQIGLLPEPPRSENGYRSYRAADVATVMRIRLLEAAGFSLAQIAETFERERCDGGARPLPELLDEIDGALSRQIERLEAQRRAIRTLRERGGDVDALVPCGSHIVRLRAAGAGEGFAALERNSLLLAHLSSDSRDFDAVARLFDMIAADGLIERYAALGEALLALPADANEDLRNQLAHATANLLAPYIARLAGAGGSDVPGAGGGDNIPERALDLLKGYETETFSPAQRDVTARALALLSEALHR